MDGNKKNKKVWIIPIILLLGIILFMNLSGKKMKKNQVGKPEILIADYSGVIEEINVSKGDVFSSGKVLLRYKILSENKEDDLKSDEQKKVDVTLKKIKPIKFDETIELPGIIRPALDLNISAQVSGKITKINVDKGDHVKKGDVLAQIEKKDYEVVVKRTKAAFNYAKSQFERSKKLISENAISEADFDRVKSELASSESMYINAKLALDRCEIIADENGIVNNKFIEEGQLVNSGTHLFNIINIDEVKIDIGIPEQDINDVKNIRFVDFSVSALNNKIIRGEVNNVSYSSDQFAHVYPVELKVKNSDWNLLPGMIVKANVIKNTYENAVLVSIFSVIPDDDNNYFTYIYEGGKAKKVYVELGNFQDRDVMIKKGLKPGDLLIEKGLRMVKNGSLLEVINSNEVGL